MSINASLARGFFYGQTKVMEALPDFLRAFVALSIVIVMMLGVAWGARRFPQMQKFVTGGKEQRLKLVTSLMLDARHRIVIVKIDETEKTFLLSPESAMEVRS